MDPNPENYDITGEKQLPDKITAIKNLSKSYEMRMRGFKLDTSNDKYVIAGKALAGEEFINLTSGIINSFAENANLMTTKSSDKFMMEFADAFYRVNVMVLNDESIPANTQRAVVKIFKDTMSNLGDIITGSRQTMEKVFERDKMYDSYGGDLE